MRAEAMTLVGAAAGAAGGRKAMKEKTITVSHEVSPEYGNAVSVGTFGEKKCASTMQFVPRHTEIRHRRNIENLSACYSTAGLMNRTKSARCAARRARRWTGSERSNPCSMPFVRRGNYSFRVLSDITRLQSSDERETGQTVHRHRCRSHKFDDSIMRQFLRRILGA